MRVVHHWTQEDSDLVQGLRDRGFSYVEIGRQIGRGRKAVEAHLRRIRRNAFKPIEEWTPEIDAVIFRGGTAEEIRANLAAGGFVRSVRSIRRRAMLLRGENPQVPRTPTIQYACRGDDDFQRAMLAAGYQKIGPDNRPGTENPRPVTPAAFVASKSALADI